MGRSEHRGIGRGARRAFVVAVVVALVAVAVPASASASPSGSYVALGDSYTAGPLIPNQQLDPLGCLRSDRNYPHLVERSLGAPQFHDVSCSGAETGDMFSSQGVWPGPNPPQLDALDSSTSVVTLGISGNDIGFSSILLDCVAWTPWSRPCKSDYVTWWGHDELRARIAATAPKVASVLRAIRDRAPHAEVFVVGYPTILPQSGWGCWPVMPLTPTDVTYLRGVEQALNTMLAQQAAAAGAHYVDTYTPSIGHDACQWPSNRWVEPIVPASLAAPVHPNDEGEAGMAAAVLAAMHAAGVR